MQILSEFKYKIVEEIDSSPRKSLPRMCILLMDKRHTTHIQHGLDFLEKENYLTKEEINGIVFYSIKEGNKSLAIVRIMCPKCKTVRNIYNPNQVVAACANPDCMTKDRKRRHIEIRRKKIVYDMSKFLHVYNG